MIENDLFANHWDTYTNFLFDHPTKTRISPQIQSNNTKHLHPVCIHHSSIRKTPVTFEITTQQSYVFDIIIFDTDVISLNYFFPVDNIK